MSRFRFVHVADLHLDSPFRGIARRDPHVAEILINATFEAFDRVIALCIEEKADFLLVAGDSFDAAERSLRAERAFHEGLAALSEAGIRSFVVHGNHDPLESAGSAPMPDLVHVFGVEAGSVPVERDGREIARVFGVSYPIASVTENLARTIRRDAETPFAVGLLHANVGGRPGHEPYAPCSADDLISGKMDYWALGHIHAREVIREHGPAIVYPGNSQGRNPRETGPRGAVLVDVEDGHPSFRFIETDVVRWESLDVSIDGVEDERTLTRRIHDSVVRCQESAGSRSLIIRLTIRGRGTVHRRIARPGVVRGYLSDIERDLSGGERFVLIESETVRTGPPVDIEALTAEPSLLGEFVRIAEAARKEGDERRALRAALGTVDERVAAAGLTLDLSEQELSALIERAEMLGIDLLSRENE